ncbi:TM2 domain-containing protein [Parasediminibacterium sp. JCM 36343]|uniref:TM2 domain-containing protein n=1 Tax=Parasediminibacterium sp. JCM 36343 TaxID=3374279 RepID=UPI00397B9070
MRPKIINLIPSIEAEELAYLHAVTKDLTDDKLQTFLAVYNGKRKKSEVILIGCVLGFVAAGGIQRFMVGQIGMGVLYLFTGGLCLIGTIVDLINYKQIAFDYNAKMAVESMGMVNAF